MKNLGKCAIMAIAVALAIVSTADAAKKVTKAEKVERNYINIKSPSQFDTQIKMKKHTVVLFFDRSDKGGERAYDRAKKAYDAAADVELYKDQKDLQFLKVNTAYGDGDNHKIFDEYRVLNDGSIARKPVIFLFNNGKMIDNQLSGNVTEKRVRRFVESYFKDLRKAEEKPAPAKSSSYAKATADRASDKKKPAKTKMMKRQKSSLYGG